jgi:hypothetical protein
LLSVRDFTRGYRDCQATHFALSNSTWAVCAEIEQSETANEARDKTGSLLAQS